VRRCELAILPGDGIGPEVTAAALEVLGVLAGELARGGLEIAWTCHPVGGAALAQGLPPLPEETLRAALAADGVLLGAVGAPQWDHLPPAERPESALIALREAMGVYANLRPASGRGALGGRSPLRGEVAGLDLLLVRELTGGLYYGRPRGREGVRPGRRAVDTMAYGEDEIRRVAHVAFRAARRRRRRLTSVDKRNVLETSALWREVVDDVHEEYPDVRLEHQLVDSMALRLVASPASFDVVLAENMFGDILSDEIGGIVGSLGVLPSASVGDGRGLYEPVHGSAPDIAGQDAANPLGAILSLALCCELSLDRPDLARRVEEAVEGALALGLRTADIATGRRGERLCGTREMAGAVAALLADRLGSGAALGEIYA